MPQNPNSGLTLVEVLISMLIVSFLGAAIYMSLTQGLRVWQAAVKESRSGAQEFFFEEMKSELRNAFVSNAAGLRGKNHQLEFETLVADLRGSGSEKRRIQVPARVSYEYDANRQAIRKQVILYEKTLNPRLTKISPQENFLDDVTGMHLEYYRQPQRDLSASWISQWNEPCFPEAVKLTVELDPVRKAKEVRIFSLPMTGACTEQEKL